MVDVNVKDIPSLQFINSLILKIENAKQRNNAEEFQMLQEQLKDQIENVDVKNDVLGITVSYEDY